MLYDILYFILLINIIYLNNIRFSIIFVLLMNEMFLIQFVLFLYKYK